MGRGDDMCVFKELYSFLADNKNYLNNYYMDYIIKLKCNNCQNDFEIDLKDYDLSWDVADSFDHGENGMGEEVHYESVIEVECPTCGEDKDPIIVTLSVWEYPVGAFNNQEIEVEGASLLKECDLQGISPIGDVE